MSQMFTGKTVFILGVGSDIGRSLAGDFLNQGARVIGTYRTAASVSELGQPEGLTLMECDVASPESVANTVRAFAALAQPWDVFVSCVGVLDPIGRFFSLDFAAWEESVRVNSLAQLRVLHALQPHRQTGEINHAIFFAGGGTNSPFRNYSAYCLGKLVLIKMCELLDDEDPALNAVILGTGWVNTKIHRQTLRNATAAEANHARTREFLERAESGTSLADIFACIEWCVRNGRELVGGRNFSIVHDAWHHGGQALLARLQADPHHFKLRRHGNG